MDYVDERRFIVVSPEGVNSVFTFHRAEGYIREVIQARPGPELLERLNESLKVGGICGILTRGSLAHYLYVHQVPVPIFLLKYELYNILELLQICADEGHHKICVFEISHTASDQDLQEQRSSVQMGDYVITYQKFYDWTQMRDEMLSLHTRGLVDVVVGDVEPILLARELGIPCHNFLINEDTYLSTVSDARYSIDIAQKEKAQDDFIKVITNIISEAVFISDSNGVIQKQNLPAKRLFPHGKSNANVRDIFGLDLEEILYLPANHLLTVNGQNFVINTIPHMLDQTPVYALIVRSVDDVEQLAMSIQKQNREHGLVAKASFADMICEAPATKQLLYTSRKYAKSNGTVLISGETGTGKEVFAQSIHNESLRADGPFVAINCAAFNENLIESELFGYEKGAFTGALPSGKRGLFELAHRGSLFLDEIGELSPSLQAKLLRALQEREVMRVGGDRVIPVDVRVIAATNQNLRKMVAEKKFREDLYYRLALLEVELPPLRERREDIVPLFISFLSEIAEREHRSVFWENDQVFTPLLSYDWPGNIRELRNFSERVVLLCDEYRLKQEFLADMMRQKQSTPSGDQWETPITNDLKQLESRYLDFLLTRFGGDRETLCSYLGISRSTLWRKLSSSHDSMEDGAFPDPHF